VTGPGSAASLTAGVLRRAAPLLLVALFTEMDGFPPTIYHLPAVRVADQPLPGHRPPVARQRAPVGDLLRLGGDPHVNPLHLLSNGLILAGFVLLGAAWNVLYEAQRAGQLATTGPYAHVRHPRYVGFSLIMPGFLVQGPTPITLAMFPVLVTVYVRLAPREERDARAGFGAPYARYAAATPAFIPRLPRPAPKTV
jgi:hypothetical protein